MRRTPNDDEFSVLGTDAIPELGVIKVFVNINSGACYRTAQSRVLTCGRFCLTEQKTHSRVLTELHSQISDVRPRKAWQRSTASGKVLRTPTLRDPAQAVLLRIG